tara:strand:- start:865 stop:2931 length:2067 start_codon:yes stop_codon:yes gene_type:complete
VAKKDLDQAEKLIALQERLEELLNSNKQNQEIINELGRGRLRQLAAEVEREEHIYQRNIARLRQQQAAAAGDQARQAVLADELAYYQKLEAHRKQGVRDSQSAFGFEQAHAHRLKEILNTRGRLEKATQREKDAVKKVTEAQKAQAGLFQQNAHNSINLQEAMEAGLKSGTELLDTANAELVAYAMAMPDLTGQWTAGTFRQQITAQRDDIRSITKDTGIWNQELQDVFVDSIDPASAAARGMKGFQSGLQGVGITSADVKAGIGALVTNFAGFGLMLDENASQADRLATREMSNLAAGLKQLGVAEASTAKQFDIFRKVMKKSPKETLKSSKSILHMAKSLKIDAGKAFEDFNSNMDTFAQFGSRATDVFAGLQVQSVATGIAVSELASKAMQLDTFEGAAQAAGKLNTFLGDTYLSTMDLVHADPDEKFDLIKEALGSAGMEYEDLNRRQKQVIANAIAGGDVEFASRMFGSEEEQETANEALKKTALSQQELEEQIKQSRTSVETLRNNMSGLAGGFQELIDGARGASVEASASVAEAFSTAVRQSSSLKEAVTGLVGSLSAIGQAQEYGAGLNSIKTAIAAMMTVLGGENSEAGKKLLETIQEIMPDLLQGVEASPEVFQRGRAPGPQEFRFADNDRKSLDDFTVAANGLVEKLDNLKIHGQIDLLPDKVTPGFAQLVMDRLET